MSHIRFELFKRGYLAEARLVVELPDVELLPGVIQQGILDCEEFIKRVDFMEVGPYAWKKQGTCFDPGGRAFWRTRNLINYNNQESFHNTAEWGEPEGKLFARVCVDMGIAKVLL